MGHRTMTMSTPRDALLVTAHGTVQSLDEIPAFLQVIRRGRPASEQLVREVSRRYEAIGGRSPLSEITERQTQQVAARLGVRGYMGMRLWRPSITEALERALADGATRIISLPAAPFSTEIYHDAVARSLAELGASERVVLLRVPAYATHPALIDAFARRAREAGALDPAVHVVFTAHSLPMIAVERGDRYPVLVRACVEAVASRLGLSAAHWTLAYQSQGASEEPWLGPTLTETFDVLAAKGVRDVVLCPVGFLTDHVEVLYDLDIEAVAWAAERRIRVRRARTLNADPDGCDALAAVVRAELRLRDRSG
jgi:ferrochelatase